MIFSKSKMEINTSLNTSAEFIRSELDSSRSDDIFLYLNFKSIVLAKTSSSFLDKSLTSPISFKYILIGSS